MTEQENIKNILAFLSRVQIQGNEAFALLEAQKWLEKMQQPQNSKPEKQSV